MSRQFELSLHIGIRHYRVQVLKQEWGYTHRFAVSIEDTGLLFEPDDERKYRAILMPGQSKPLQDFDQQLLEAIAKELEKIDRRQ
jgi:hypothetical protein